MANADAQHDSISRTLDIIGDRWTLQVLRGVFRGVRRFSALHDDLGIAKNLLTDRLNKLVEHEVLHKVQYQDRPIRYEYCLTERGRDLSPSLIALMRWGDRWCNDGDAPVVLVHTDCGTEIVQDVRCPSCDVHLGATDVTTLDGRQVTGPDDVLDTSRPHHHVHT